MQLIVARSRRCHGHWNPLTSLSSPRHTTAARLSAQQRYGSPPVFVGVSRRTQRGTLVLPGTAHAGPTASAKAMAVRRSVAKSEDLRDTLSKAAPDAPAASLIVAYGGRHLPHTLGDVSCRDLHCALGNLKRMNVEDCLSQAATSATVATRAGHDSPALIAIFHRAGLAS